MACAVRSEIAKPTGTNPAPGTISLIANAGGHAASIAIAPTDAGPREQYIALDPIMSTDHLSCTLDLWVEGAPTAEEFDVFRFFTAKSDAGPYPVGAKIVLVPQSVQNVFSVQLRYDTSSGFISLGTMSANVWKTVTLSLKADGKVSGSVAGAPVASTFDLGPDAFVTGVAVGIHRKEAAEIWVDNFRCVQ